MKHDPTKGSLSGCVVAVMLMGCSASGASAPEEGDPNETEDLPSSAASAIGTPTSTTTGSAVGSATTTASPTGSTSTVVAQPASYPAGVTFEWAETLPGAGTCKAGHYVGDFAGDYFWNAAGLPSFGPNFPIPIVGQIDMHLAESQDGEFFEITNGRIAGMTNGYIPFTVDLVGRLNCTTGRLEGGQLLNGQYAFAAQTYFYEGVIDAAYDKLTGSFVNGTWSVTEPAIPANGGRGGWRANWVP